MTIFKFCFFYKNSFCRYSKFVLLLFKIRFLIIQNSFSHYSKFVLSFIKIRFKKRALMLKLTMCPCDRPAFVKCEICDKNLCTYSVLHYLLTTFRRSTKTETSVFVTLNADYF